MLRKDIKYNTESRKLCVATYDESKDLFGNFSNEEFDKFYSSIINKCELRGLDFNPVDKEMTISQSSLNHLKKQLQLFESLFNAYLDIYKGIRENLIPHKFSTPRYIDEVEMDKSYLFVFNDGQDGMQYDLTNYETFLNLYSYPDKILKTNDNILRSQLTELIDIEGLKVSGFLRSGEEDNLFYKLLHAQMDKRIDNEYFKMAETAYKQYVYMKKRMDAKDYIDKKLAPFGMEYLILKDVQFEGTNFGRDDFNIDRIIVTNKGIFVISLLNEGNANETLCIPADNLWHLKDVQGQIIQDIPSPVEKISLDCVAIKRLIRTQYDEDILPVIPIIVVANDNVKIDNQSMHTVVRGTDLYSIIEGYPKQIEMSQAMDIGNMIYSYRYDEEKRHFDSWLATLESAYTVYNDEILYNHIRFYLPRLTQWLWKVQRDDYYKNGIRKRTIMKCVFGVLSVIGLILYGSHFFINKENIPAIFLSSMFLCICIGNIVNEQRYIGSWKHGYEEGDCFKVEKHIGIFGGFGMMLIEALVLSAIMIVPMMI